MKRLLIFFTIIAINTFPEFINAKENNSCAVCHSDINIKFIESVHWTLNISCTACHGGNPSDLTFASMSKNSGFKGKIPRKSIPSLCARCHSDIKMMLQYGEYIDQYSIYLQSQHGKNLLRGDTKVAVCTDCHGIHDIKRTSDPSSTVFPTNVPYTCSKCHSDKKYMQEYKIPTDQFEKYKNSVHGKLRLGESDTRSPGCPDCHGTHGTTPPGVSEIQNVCGKCHSPQRRYFNESPHLKAMEMQKINECVSCHGYHGIQPPSPELFTSSDSQENGNGCLKCHDKNSSEYRTAIEIKELILKAESAVQKSIKLLDKAREKGFSVDEEITKINFAKTKLLELQPATHSLSVSIVQDFAEDVIMGATDVSEMIKAKLVEWRDRRIMLVFNILVFLTIIISLIIKRRRSIKDGSKNIA